MDHHNFDAVSLHVNFYKAIGITFPRYFHTMNDIGIVPGLRGEALNVPEIYKLFLVEKALPPEVKSASQYIHRLGVDDH